MTFIGPHRAYHHKKHANSKILLRISGLIDRSIYIIGILSVVSNVPQLWNIWVLRQTTGVSIISWASFLIGSFFWFGYGVIHKEKAIIVINGFIILVQAGIVLGLIVQGR